MIRQAEKDFIKEVKKLLKDNAGANFRFIIGGELREKIPSATIDVENHHAVKHLLEQFDFVKYADDEFERYKHQSPIIINFCVYEKK